MMMVLDTGNRCRGGKFHMMMFLDTGNRCRGGPN